MRMVVDVSNLPVPEILEDLLQDDHPTVYSQSQAVQLVEESWKPNDYNAPAVPRDVCHTFVMRATNS